MAEFPALPLWTDAYLADTSHLTTTEHGAYLLLLMAMWRAGGVLPNDDKKLGRIARLTPGQWARVKETIWEFFRVTPDGITQGRLTDELTAVRRNSCRQSDKAKARWLKEKKTTDATAMPEPCPPDTPLTLPISSSEADASSEPPISPPEGGDVKPKAKRASRIPDDWQPRPEEIAVGVTECGFAEPEIARRAEEFRDYWLAEGGQRARKVDWDRTFRNRLRALADRRGRGHGPPDKRAAAAEAEALRDELRGSINGHDGQPELGGAADAGEPPRDGSIARLPGPAGGAAGRQREPEDATQDFLERAWSGSRP